MLRELRKEKGCYQANEEKLLARKTVVCCLLCTVNRAESPSIVLAIILAIFHYSKVHKI